MFTNDGFMVLRAGKLHQVCSTEDMAESVAFLLNRTHVVQVNERTRLAYNNFIALRDGHNVAKVA